MTLFNGTFYISFQTAQSQKANLCRSLIETVHDGPDLGLVMVYRVQVFSLADLFGHVNKCKL